MTVSELRRLKGPEAENPELKRLLADTMPDNAGLKGLLAKNPDACRPPGCCEHSDDRASVHATAGWLGYPDRAWPVRPTRIATRGSGNVWSHCRASTEVWLSHSCMPGWCASGDTGIP